MRTWCFLLPAILLPAIPIDEPRGEAPSRGGGDIVINEVYYDHPGVDGGWEFIELFNPGDVEADCSGLSLEQVDGASGSVRLLWRAPAGSALGAGCCLLAAGSEYGPAPGFELEGRIENGPDAVRLLRGSAVIDCVGYGGASLAPCEGRPFPRVIPGRSIARRPDGFDADDNAADLVEAAPTPGRRNFHRLDIALDCSRSDLLCCAGAPALLPLSVRNAGLERFAAAAMILASRSGTEAAIEFRRAVELDLGPDESVDLDLTIPSVGAGGALVAVIDAPGDGDPLNDTILVDLRLSPGAIVISEIMYRPWPEEGEWVELYCRSDAGMDLSGWTLGDDSGGGGAIPAATVIAAGGYLVVAQDPAGFEVRRRRVPCPVTGTVSGWPRLNDAEDGVWADVVGLRDASGAIVDMVPYPALCGREYGRSLERVSIDACGPAPGGVVQRCLDPGGATPGAPNSVDAPRRPGAGLLAEPNPFGRSRHGAVRVTAGLRTGEEAFGARVLDIDGALVRHLAGGPSGAPVVSFLWDGLDDDGVPAPVGIYVCVVEFMTRGGGICRRERCVIVIGGS